MGVLVLLLLQDKLVVSDQVWATNRRELLPDPAMLASNYLIQKYRLMLDRFINGNELTMELVDPKLVHAKV